MKWLKPKDNHIIYESLSAIAGNRLELLDSSHAKCTSTSQGKYYSISYDHKTRSIMSNDNMAYYRDEVSYPMVAFLMANGEIDFDRSILGHFKGIKWKDINQKNKNDYLKSVAEVLSELESMGVDIEFINSEVKKIFNFVLNLELNKFGKKELPPQAY